MPLLELPTAAGAKGGQQPVWPAQRRASGGARQAYSGSPSYFGEQSRHRAEPVMRTQALQAVPQGSVPAHIAGLLATAAAPSVPSPQPHVMVADNEPMTCRAVSDYLRQNNMRVSVASGTQDVARLMASERFNMVVLDLQIGQNDGLDLLRDLRAGPDLPIIAITGQMDDEIDRVVSLELGADDCLTKPYSLRELLARIRGVLRRTGVAAGHDTRAPGRDKAFPRFQFGSWTLNSRTRQLTDAEGTPVALTKGEYALLAAFLNAPQRPLSREFLLQATRVHEDVFDRSIDVQILRLRRKLDADPAEPSVIRTERGVGYTFTLAVDTA